MVEASRSNQPSLKQREQNIIWGKNVIIIYGPIAIGNQNKREGLEEER